MPNGRNAGWNSHAGEGVVWKALLPMVVTLFPNSHAGEGVAGESRLPNGRNAVPNSHAGEGVV